METLARETGGKSYKAHKYSLDYAERPQIDYGDKEIIWRKAAETVKHRKNVDLSMMCQRIAERDNQILSYFLDGSRRVFKVDDIAYPQSGRRSGVYPAVAGQIGVGCCKRVGREMVPEKFRREIVLSLPSIADADGVPGFFPAMAKKLSACGSMKRAGVEFSAILSYPTSKSEEQKYEDFATARIQERMMECEKELVEELVCEGKLNQNNYLIKDGSLEYKPSKKDRKNKRQYQTFKNNYNWVLGVSKNFSPEICKDINGRSNPGVIAELPLYHRTPVACYESSILGDVQFAIWYVRLRDQKKTLTPFDGVIKVEKILVTDDEISGGMDSNLVDMLSAYLINERSPVCYGSDLRWANHLYPVYLTETFVKSKCLGTASFLHLF